MTTKTRMAEPMERSDLPEGQQSNPLSLDVNEGWVFDYLRRTAAHDEPRWDVVARDVVARLRAGASGLDVGDEVSIILRDLPSQLTGIVGKVEAVRSDGLVTAAFPQDDFAPMRITAMPGEFVRIRTSPDVAAVEARVRAEVAEEIALALDRATNGVYIGTEKAVGIAREHAGKGLPSAPTALPDVVGTQEHQEG